MSPGGPVRLFYDGGCPLCAREIRFLRRLDRGRGRLLFQDIEAPGFDARALGLDPAALMDHIHGTLPDGTVIEGMEVFRRAYRAVGLGWLLAPTGWPGLRRVADAAYRVFARNRLRWTGRTAACTEGRCAAGHRDPEPIVGRNWSSGAGRSPALDSDEAVPPAPRELPR